MKRLVCLILIIALCSSALLLVACGTKPDDIITIMKEEYGDKASVSDESVTQWRDVLSSYYSVNVKSIKSVTKVSVSYDYIYIYEFSSDSDALDVKYALNKYLKNEKAVNIDNIVVAGDDELVYLVMSKIKK